MKFKVGDVIMPIDTKGRNFIPRWKIIWISDKDYYVRCIVSWSGDRPTKPWTVPSPIDGIDRDFELCDVFNAL